MKNNILLNVIIAILAILLPVKAGNFIPTSGPGDTMHTLEDIYCRIASCTPAAYGLDSSASPTSTMYSLQDIYDILPEKNDYSRQAAIVYTDNRCTNNNNGGASACSAGNMEYVGEESTWSSSTDSNIAGVKIASGVVYKDLRTGLYWSDTMSTSSNNNTASSSFNNFTVNCTDSSVANGTCLAENYAVKGDAITYCLNLVLDKDGNGVDDTNWYLPSIKELYQAYIDGAQNNFPTRITDNDIYSSTELGNSTSNVAIMLFKNPIVTSRPKTSFPCYVICVHR